MITKEEAIKWYEQELIYLRAAERINSGCGTEEVAEWNRQAEIHQMAIDALRAQPAWINVKDALPTKGDDYLCRCCIDGHTDYPFYMVLRYFLVDKNPHFQHECEHGLNVTHWMPIPKVGDGDG